MFTSVGNFLDACVWCRANLDDLDWKSDAGMRSYTIRFVNESDAVIVKLRFS
jgi:hypothetical protein